MSETPEQPEQREPPHADEPPSPGLSRRDFLRRASKEAVETGTKIVPGATIARTALGIGAPNAEGAAPKSLAQRFAAWRNERNTRRKEESS